jgi:hypothetical protein
MRSTSAGSVVECNSFRCCSIRLSMSTHDWHTISPFSVGKQTTEISSKGRQRGTKAALTNCACGWTLLALVVRLASHRERGFLFRPVLYCDAVACKCPAVTLRANTATIFPELLARSVASTCACRTEPLVPHNHHRMVFDCPCGFEYRMSERARSGG